MRNVMYLLAVLLALVGAVWTLQGAGWLGGSFMTGERLWLWIGLGCILAAAVLVAAANRR